jgi:hypothetical protein
MVNDKNDDQVDRVDGVYQLHDDHWSERSEA